jgi:hypothetical protein
MLCSLRGMDNANDDAEYVAEEKLGEPGAFRISTRKHDLEPLVLS